ncbi:MAG TPA: hypothetical protein PK205_07140 [Promineifilum sp.]|nr:hypothetical protein [Promineifilum sp.]
MNALAPVPTFEPAYRQLRQSERTFVDGLILHIEREALRTREPMLAILRSLKAVDFEQHEQDMLQRLHVRTAIYDRVRELSEQSELNVYATLKELRGIAYGSMGNYLEVDEYGMPRLTLGKCTPEQLSAIKSVKYELTMRGTQKIEIVLHDKLSALDKVMRYQGLLADDNEHWNKMLRKTTGDAPELAADTTDEQAAEEYSRMING